MGWGQWVMPCPIFLLSQVPAVQNTWDALLTIVRTEGPRGLFRGVVPTVATNAPFSALYYMFYKNLQSQFTKVKPSKDLQLTCLYCLF
jgi:hypothetical protein